MLSNALSGVNQVLSVCQTNPTMVSLLILKFFRPALWTLNSRAERPSVHCNFIISNFLP